ncbi:MAG: hypothetical protein HC813_01515 [Planctomycetes bacterium]|nr:hypothetical protein [Planctomycetota bacterium]
MMAFPKTPPTFTLIPRSPCHMFWVVRREPCYLYASPAETRIDLSGMPRQKTILARPTVGGEPLPEGSWLFPGRLDLVSCSSVLELQQSLAGCFLRLGAPDETWEGRTLPAADSLTAWHPDLGLVHYGWKADERPEGALYPGCAVVELAPGRKAIGRVSVYNIWKGTGKIRTTPPEKLLRRSFTEETRTLTFRGLPPGAYSFYFQVFFTDPATGESRKRQGTEEFLITQENPLFRLVLDEP